MFVLIHLRRDNHAKILKAQRYHLPKGVIKKYSIIITRKIFSDQLIDSGTKWYEDIRKWTTGQGQDYTTGCLLDYNHIKNIDW